MRERKHSVISFPGPGTSVTRTIWWFVGPMLFIASANTKPEQPDVIFGVVPVSCNNAEIFSCYSCPCGCENNSVNSLRSDGGQRLETGI